MIAYLRIVLFVKAKFFKIDHWIDFSISGLRKSRGMALTNLAIVRWTLIAMPGTRAVQIVMD